MNETIPTVEKTVALDLCVSCGICKEACPKNAIELKFVKGQYIPLIKAQKCNSCKLCLKVCPGIEVDYNDLYDLDKKDLPENIFTGYALECYTAYSTDEFKRVNGASGGVVTTLITKLLSNSTYKGAFVLPKVKMDSSLAKLVYTQNEEDIRNASRSKYLPVSVENVVKRGKELDSAIIVGTPCHIHGIKKYMKLYNINISKFLFLGLFCEKTLNYNLLDFYDWKYGKGRKVKDFYYRHKGKDGWPGHTKMVFDNCDELFVDRKIRMGIKKFFQLNRCFFCIDKLNQFADISFGDCYIKGEETELGQSSVVVRTERGKKALDSVRSSLNMKEVNISAVIKSQKIEKKVDNMIYDQVLNKTCNNLNKGGFHAEIEEKATVKDEQVLENYQTLINLGKEKEFKIIDKQLSKSRIRIIFIKFAKYIIKKIGIKR